MFEFVDVSSVFKYNSFSVKCSVKRNKAVFKNNSVVVFKRILITRTI